MDYQKAGSGCAIIILRVPLLMYVAIPFFHYYASGKSFESVCRFISAYMAILMTLFFLFMLAVRALMKFSSRAVSRTSNYDLLRLQEMQGHTNMDIYQMSDMKEKLIAAASTAHRKTFVGLIITAICAATWMTLYEGLWVGDESYRDPWSYFLKTPQHWLILAFIVIGIIRRRYFKKQLPIVRVQLGS